MKFRYLNLLDRYFLVVLFLVSIFLTFNRYGKTNSPIIFSDDEGYYMYLPAVFINHGFENLHINTHNGFPPYEGTNKVFTKYYCGVAILELPLFLLAHLIALIFKLKADGYSEIYNISIMFSAISYASLGLYFLKKTLKKYFPVVAVLFTLFAFYAGTNLYFYTIVEPGKAHVYSFFLISAFIFFTPTFLNKPTIKNTILLALIFGLIVLVRPTNIIICLFLLLYDVYTFKHLTDKFLFIRRNIMKLLLFPITGFLIFLPQLFYWKYITGNFFIDPYKEESFIFWNNPKFFQVLFHVQNGLFVYNPILLLSMVGMFIILVKQKLQANAIFIIFILATYIFASWWTWWFGAAFGHRCFVDYYSLLAIPFAYMITYINKIHFNTLKFIIYLCLIFLMYYNMKMIYMYLCCWDGPEWNWSSYFDVAKNLFKF